jgi:hypothetical protein
LQQSRAFATGAEFAPTQGMRHGKAAWERVMRRNLTNTFRELMRTFAQPFDPYRPELHYMRGPGPKCRAKRGGTVTKAAPTVAGAIPTLGEIAEAHA